MRKILLPGFLFFQSLSLFAQTAQKYNTIQVQKILSDSQWNHTLDEADLILKVEIKRKYYMTFYGHFFFDVLEVMKGDYRQPNGHFELGLMDFSQDAYEKKYRALDSNIVYIGFKKITEEHPSGYFMTDTVTGIKWGFWMSEIVDRRQRKGAEFDFCHRILLHLCCGISSKDTYEAKMVELKKKWAVEDSLFDIAETKRCAAVKDSLHLISDFEKDSVPEGELIFLPQYTEDLLGNSNNDFEKDSLEGIDFWMLNPFADDDCISFGEMDSWGILRDKPEELSQREEEMKRKLLDSLVSGIGNIDTHMDICIFTQPVYTSLLPVPRKEIPESLFSYKEVETEPRAAFILPPLVSHSYIPVFNDFRVLEYSPDDLSTKFEEDSITSSTESSFLFYPNPASDFISIYFEEQNHPVQFSIVDMRGRKVYDEKIMGPLHKVEVSDFSSGTYFLMLHIGGGQVKKLVVE